MIQLDTRKTQEAPTASIKVLGIGGAGGNTLNSIIETGYEGISYIAANTDAQALDQSKADVTIQLGVKSTKGLGTGANPEMGKRAAEENLTEIMEHLETADIVFLTAGMGGGTGSGALPVIARALKEKGILSIAVVTKPFTFEGKRRSTIADAVVEQLKEIVDTLIVIPNQKLLEVVDEQMSMIEAFGMINEMLGQSVRSISDIITRPGHINVDFADVRTIMKDRGLALMGTAKASHADRAEEATLEAISSPLLENMSIEGARSVLLNITGSKNLSLHEVSKAASIIYEQADPDAQIILGSVIDESLGDSVCVTIIASGFDHSRTKQQKQSHNEEVKVRATVRDVHTSLGARADALLEKAPELLTKNDVLKENVAQDKEKVRESKENVYALESQSQEHDVVDQNDLDVPAFMRHEQQMQHDK